MLAGCLRVVEHRLIDDRLTSIEMAGGGDRSGRGMCAGVRHVPAKLCLRQDSGGKYPSRGARASASIR